MHRAINTLFILLSFMALPALAVIETYEFASEEQRAQYQQMIDDLRCPKCQNQNLSGSNSPIAKDLRREVHRLISEGQSDAAIKAFMVKRYGNFVLYEPPLDKNTILIWSLPAILLALAFIVVFFIKARSAKFERRAELTEQESQRLKEILASY
jgi:cytochrome c-type biogenesis protein CcmH